MKAKFYVLPLLAAAFLASCGPNSTGLSSNTSQPSTSSEATSVAPTFESFTLSQLHEARVNKTLPSLNGKLVAVKGKVTFAKYGGADNEDGVLTIQSGKYAVEVTYPSAYSVNVGDAVEVKGAFMQDASGDVDIIWISTFKSTNPAFDIKVINETISVETVTITKEADLIEYDSSKSSMTFTVTGNRNNAAFVGKLSGGDTEFIVANKLFVADKFPEAPYEVGDNVKYDGVFSFSGDSSAKVIRYFDKAGFSKAN